MPLWFSRKNCRTASWQLCPSCIEPLPASVENEKNWTHRSMLWIAPEFHSVPQMTCKTSVFSAWYCSHMYCLTTELWFAVGLIWFMCRMLEDYNVDWLKVLGSRDFSCEQPSANSHKQTTEPPYVRLAVGMKTTQNIKCLISLSPASFLHTEQLRGRLLNGSPLSFFILAYSNG